MGEVTAISWCDHTLNPWIGCTKISPACDSCYADVLMGGKGDEPVAGEGRRLRRVKWGPGEKRIRTVPSTWNNARKWNRRAVEAGTRPFVFCASLADVFDNEIDPEWRIDLFDLIRETPQLVWLLLTKRIGNVLKMAPSYMQFPPNVAIGATMANQDEYERDSRKLSKVKDELSPLFTFGSFEPLLGKILLDSYAPDWIIVGGESGRNARPMDIEWARRLHSDSLAYGRIFHFKQVGGTDAAHGGHKLDGQLYNARPAVAALTEA